jgi:anaerobic selenocysteine-containing dehydrogenase
MHTVIGACPHDCPDTCSLVTTVENGIAIRVQGNPNHPMTDGVLCTKVSRYTERTYHPDRILHPMKRAGPKGSGQFAPVSWEEALSDIANRLTAIAKHDPQAILPYSYAGTMGQVQGEAMAMRFLVPRWACGWNFLWSPNSSLFGAVIQSVVICIFGALLKRPNATVPN